MSEMVGLRLGLIAQEESNASRLRAVGGREVLAAGLGIPRQPHGGFTACGGINGARNETPANGDAKDAGPKNRKPRRANALQGLHFNIHQNGGRGGNRIWQISLENQGSESSFVRGLAWLRSAPHGFGVAPYVCGDRNRWLKRNTANGDAKNAGPRNRKPRRANALQGLHFNIHQNGGRGGGRISQNIVYFNYGLSAVSLWVSPDGWSASLVGKSPCRTAKLGLPASPRK